MARKFFKHQHPVVHKSAGGTWGFRYYDREGTRKRVGGYKTKGEARQAADALIVTLRTGMDVAPPGQTLTFAALVQKYLAQHDAGEARLAKMRWALEKATAAFGSVPIDVLDPPTLGAWRLTLPERQRAEVFAPVRQVLEAAVGWRMISYNAARTVKNPAVRAKEVVPFQSWVEVFAVAYEIGEYGPLVRFNAATGLRPEEWLVLERPDIDRKHRRLTVRRTYVAGRGVIEFKGKTAGSIRSVPLLRVALDALDELPLRIDTRLLFPNSSGGVINLNNFRSRDWYPAIESAGLAKRGPYALRHTYATFLLDTGMSIFKVARWMGTSAEMIERHYGHRLIDSDERELDRLDSSFDLGSSDADALPL
jgi:integrase